MKILLISDLHDTNYNNLNKIKDLEYDMCFLLGDIHIQALRYLKNILNLDVTYGITGNHEDFDFLKRNNIKDIHCHNIEINGIKISGFSGSVRYKRGMYAMYTQEEANQKILELQKCDILISHDTGYHYFDNASENVHDGFYALDDYIKTYSPKYNFFGHYHENKVFNKYNTKCICTYQCNIFDDEKEIIYNVF